MQDKANRSVEVTRLKARKISELDQLKELQNEQSQLLSKAKKVPETGLKKIMERAKSIGIKRKELVAIEPTYDNAIEAVKLRIEKQLALYKMTENKKRWLLINEIRRNKVVEMEQAIKEHLREYEDVRMSKIKKGQYDSYQQIQRKLHEKRTRLKALEEMEQIMLKKLNNTRSIESYEAAKLDRSNMEIKPEKFTGELYDKYMENIAQEQNDYTNNSKALGYGQSGSKHQSKYNLNKPVKLDSGQVSFQQE